VSIRSKIPTRGNGTKKSKNNANDLYNLKGSNYTILIQNNANDLYNLKRSNYTILIQNNANDLLSIQSEEVKLHKTAITTPH
jgi:hypothetical protein